MEIREMSDRNNRRLTFGWQEKLTQLVEIAIYEPKELTYLAESLSEEKRVMHKGRTREELLAQLNDEARSEKLDVVRQRIRCNKVMTLSPGGKNVNQIARE